MFFFQTLSLLHPSSLAYHNNLDDTDGQKGLLGDNIVGVLPSLSNGRQTPLQREIVNSKKKKKKKKKSPPLKKKKKSPPLITFTFTGKPFILT